MAFHGRYGHLSAVEAAIESLKEIERYENISQLEQKANGDCRDKGWYEANRTLCIIEGLQMIILKNGKSLSFSKLPLYYKPKK